MDIGYLGACRRWKIVRQSRFAELFVPELEFRYPVV
jgi:hypothetical protein